MTEEGIWIQRLEKCVEAARRWETLTPGIDEVEDGSLLHQDDDGLPGTPVRSAASYGLVASIDHLALIADLSRDLTLRPSSLFTVTRAALLAASQTVWVLSGTQNERRFRALSVAADEHKNHRSYINDYANDAFIETSAPHMVPQLKELAERLTTALDSLSEIRRGNPYAGTLQATTMMKEAAEHLAGEIEMDHWLRLGFTHEWRLASAAAHARAWPMHVRSTDREPLPGGGEVRRMSASLPEFVTSVSAATLMTSEALRMWDSHRSLPA
ncbi:hypothetical protein [Arthrobacter sp. zg-Y844]|uniref:hypothetical protein n=1 Tax=Arthrobacter sp. zg-Y844 TaxID=2964612 RepID=UPI00210792E0|nr:hypothetical protein [Arthrobacter sp. zg-Y844]MCQ1986001.1 hypothetical protein [Arthrobacter sp. zg-Y844]